MDTVVCIVGAGPSGVAVAVCLSNLSIPFIVLEKDDCIGSLWKKRVYSRLRLHLGKQFCHLPHMPFSKEMPTFIPKDAFVSFLDKYASHFHINPIYHMNVESTSYDEQKREWYIEARNIVTNEIKVVVARFLVVASGENSVGFIPDLPGLNDFGGKIVHSSEYKSAEDFVGKRVLVIGSGNSGMEIAYDLADRGAITTISIRSPVHIVNRELIYLGMLLLKFLPMAFVDLFICFLAWVKFGNLSKYGIVRPNIGPFDQRRTLGLSPTLDVGTVAKIRAGEIQVQPSISNLRRNEVIFSNGKAHYFDAIIFATGYQSKANTWFKDGGYLLKTNGFPAQPIPNHWKGKDGAYCAGLSRQGLPGITKDAQNIANDIAQILTEENKM